MRKQLKRLKSKILKAILEKKATSRLKLHAITSIDRLELET